MPRLSSSLDYSSFFASFFRCLDIATDIFAFFRFDAIDCRRLRAIFAISPFFL